MNEVARTAWRQIWPILVSAAAAGSLAFFQSLGAHAGLCPTPVASVGEVGMLGGTIHIAINAVRYIGGGRV